MYAIADAKIRETLPEVGSGTEETKMTNATIDETGTRAAKIMMTAAADALLVRKIQNVDFDAVISALRARALPALDKANADAREALDARMNDVAVATWTATLQLAGIDAVREVYPL